MAATFRVCWVHRSRNRVARGNRRWVYNLSFAGQAEEREEANAQIQRQHDRELADFNAHIERERAIVDEAFRKLGDFVDSAHSLAGLSRKEWRGEGVGPEERKIIETEKRKVVSRFNETANSWDADKLRLGLLLQLEHNNDAQLQNDWSKTCTAAEAYAQCADRWRTAYDNLEPHEAVRACEGRYGDLEQALGEFTNRVIYLRSVQEKIDHPLK